MKKRKKRSKYDYHGMSNSPEYNAWKNMKGRCKGHQKKSWGDYKNRGISYCSSWNSFNQFFLDMGKRPKGFSLDRKNNDEGYSKQNCRWANKSTQQLNQRPLRKNNKSGVKGVCWDNNKKQWLVTFRSKFVCYSKIFEIAVDMRKKVEKDWKALSEVD